MSTNCKRCNEPLGQGAKFCLKCGAMADVQVDATDPLLGRVLLGRFRPIQVLGEGGMGRVYLGEQKMGTSTRQVAIKTLHPELSQDPELVARFHRECETVIELSHPNTIQFIDFGELEDKTLFIVMEYIKGESLASVLQRGAVDAARADKIVIQICGSLHEAHQRGIVHRDLKPENILLTSRGGNDDFVKVLDFGIAKRSEAEDQSKAKLTKQGMVLGTPPYMSPEQFSGQALDARSDVYSLGIIAYEMLTGRLPFEAKTPWEWATKHLTAQPSPLEAYPGGAQAAPNKRAAIVKALSKNRDDRQPGALDFLREFTGYQDAQAAWTMTALGGGTPAQTPGLPSRPADQGARSVVSTPAPIVQTAQGSMGTPPPGFGTPPPGQGAGAGTPPPGYGTPAPGYGTPPPGFGAPGQSYGTPPPGYPTPAATPGGYPSPTPSGGYPSPAPYPGTPAPGGYGGYPSQSMSQPRKGGGAGKIIAVLAVLFFVVGGVTVAGIWYVANSNGGIANNGGTDVPIPPPIVTPPVGLPPQIPSTPQNGVPPTPPYVPPNTGITLVPTTPTNPTLTPDNPPDNPPPDNPPPDNPPDNPPDTPDTPDHGPSAADEARARSMVAQGSQMFDAGNLDGAIAQLASAQRAVGRRNSILSSLRGKIDRIGANRVGNLVLRGDCAGAQALFRRLRSVHAESSASFGFGDSCRRP